MIFVECVDFMKRVQLPFWGKWQREKKRRIMNFTLLKYFFSYLILLVVLLLGFSLLFSSRIEKIYLEQQRKQTESRLDVLLETMESECSMLKQMAEQLQISVATAYVNNLTEDSVQYELATVVRQFAMLDSLVSNIAIIDYMNDSVCSSSYAIKYDGKQIQITSGTSQNTFVMEDEEIQYPSVHILTENETSYLLYFPQQGISSATIFFILNQIELCNIFRDNMLSSMYAVAMADASGNVITGINTDAVKDAVTELSFSMQEVGEYKTKDEIYAFVRPGLFEEYTIVLLTSEKMMLVEFGKVLVQCLLPIAVLGLLGLFVIYLMMQMTYVPLQQITAKYVETPVKEESFIHQLDRAFTDVLSDKEYLQQRIDKYYLLMRRSVFDSILTDEQDEMINIEQFFDVNPMNQLYILCMKEGNLVSASEYLSEMLPGKDNCVKLKGDLGQKILLFRYVGAEPEKDAILLQLLLEINTMFGCYCSISESFRSPLEIPVAYKQAVAASENWDHQKVVSFKSIETEQERHSVIGKEYQYPREILSEFSECLQALNFENAKSILNDVLNRINLLQDDDTPFPEFFVRYQLIDIITIIVNCMNQMNIAFESYKEVYLNALFYCRSCMWQEKGEEIRSALFSFLEIYQQQMTQGIVHTSQITKILEEQYCSPDFSVSMLADQFHVSVAYMSYFFKKNYGKNFSEYLWSMRLEKAKQLLTESDQSIDQVSVSVGYLNSSSFRRKFKQETGESPSAYRSAYKEKS